MSEKAKVMKVDRPLQMIYVGLAVSLREVPLQVDTGEWTHDIIMPHYSEQTNAIELDRKE